MPTDSDTILRKLRINLYYTGTDGAARKFAEEMASAGTVNMVRKAPGNLCDKYKLHLRVERY